MTATIAAASGRPLDAYVDTVSTQPLLEPLPSPGRIATTSTNEPLGITEWRLSNGVRVVLKPTTFKEDEILFRAISQGGTSLAPDRDFITGGHRRRSGCAGRARRASQPRSQQISRRPQRVGSGPTSVRRKRDCGGGASRKDLETMFQLVYLHVHLRRAPTRSRSGVFKEQLKVALANQDALPDTAFGEALNAALTQNHLRARPLKAANVDEMNLDRSLAFYKERFADASDFTFVFVGSFDLSTMKPLVERYLASLPALHRNESAKDVGIRPADRHRRARGEKRHRAQEPGQHCVHRNVPERREHRLTLRAMAEMLSGTLHRTLREELGGTYGVSVEPRFTQRPTEAYRITISFACDPARTEALTRTAFELIDKFRTDGPADAQVADAREALLRDFETNSQRNGYLLSRLVYTYESGENIEDVFNVRPLVARLSAALIRDAARSYLDTRRYVEVTLLPEARTP